jgi:tetratricopeptide (TPR) repeat protein
MSKKGDSALLLKQKGNEAYQLEEYERASDFYEEALNKTTNPEERLTLYLNLAMTKIYIHKYVEARNICDHALHLDPDNIKGLYRRGLAFFEMGEFDKSREDFNRVLKIDPNNEASKRKLERLSTIESKTREKEKKVYKSMFTGDLYPDTAKASTTKWWYYAIFIYVILFGLFATYYYRK